MGDSRVPLEAGVLLVRVLTRLRSRWPELLTLLLIILLAAQLAHWTWFFSTPNPQRPPLLNQVNSRSSVEILVNRHFFGQAFQPAAAAVATSTNANLHLKGVFAAVGALPAFAILSVDGQPNQSVRVGDPVTDAIRLDAVFPEYVLIIRNGQREKLDLDPRSNAAVTSLPTANPPAIAITQQPAVRIETQGANVFRFSRNDMISVLQDPKQLANTGRAGIASGGGIHLEEVPPGSLPERLGFRAGDVLRQINGVVMNTPADLPRLYQQLAQANEARVEIVRQGKLQQIVYQIQP